MSELEDDLLVFTQHELLAVKKDRDAFKAHAEKADELAVFLRSSYDTLLSSSQNILSDRDRLKAENEKIRDLIAIVNRDGGQGSVEEAISKWYSLQAENELLKEALRCINQEPYHDKRVAEISRRALVASGGKARE